MLCTLLVQLDSLQTQPRVHLCAELQIVYKLNGKTVFTNRIKDNFQHIFISSYPPFPPLLFFLTADAFFMSPRALTMVADPQCNSSCWDEKQEVAPCKALPLLRAMRRAWRRWDHAGN